jgi:interferon, gamma-inducible protein 30
VPSAAMSPDVERVKKLLTIQKTEEDLQKQKADLMDQVFDDAQNGKLSNTAPVDAKVFSAGFIQGAVEASKQSVEQQGKFAKQLEQQRALVKELEDVVHELEDARRKENFDKTAAAVAPPPPPPPPPSPSPPPPAPAPSAKYVAPKPPKGWKPITIDFYMEAECPGCKAFTTGLLTDALNAVGDWVELRAIPYGNAQLNNSEIQCQHGPDECIGNKIELCMMKRYGLGGDWKAWYPAFKCIEDSDDSPENASKTCLPDSGMDLAGIMDCANGAEGDLLHMAAAQMTIDLDPPHKWTPWVVMDGTPLEDKTQQILAEICKKLPLSAKEGIPQCNPKFKAVQGVNSLAARHYPPIQKCYPTDPLSELVLGMH